MARILIADLPIDRQIEYTNIIVGGTTKTSTQKTFADVVSSGLSKSADTTMSAGQIAAPIVPGGSVVSAAISGVGQLKDSIAG